jgi:DNA ligase-1
MKNPKAPDIAKAFMLAMPYEPGRLEAGIEYLGMPKLNGVRAMWVPGVGFVSRDGIPYEPGVLPHLEAELANVPIFVDGEFYVHGFSLQRINSLAGVGRVKPHPDHKLLEFHAFDQPFSSKDARTRMNVLDAVLAPLGAVKVVPHRTVKCSRDADHVFTAFTALNYEGAMYKHSGAYRMGRSHKLLKRKAWNDEDFKVVELLVGEEGKYSNTLGALICETADGRRFKVGSFTFDDAERDYIWHNYLRGTRPTTAKVKFLGWTDDKTPYHSQCLCLT